MHEPCFSHVTSHDVPAHLTLPAQEFSPLQVTLQLVACPQSTPLGQALAAAHATSHGTPAGHVTCSLHRWSASQVMTQMLPAHSPMPSHASAQSWGVTTAAPPPPPLEPPAALPLLPALAPLPRFAPLPALPPVPATLSARVPPLPPALFIPAVASNPAAVSASNKSLGAGPPHATPQSKAAHTPSRRSPP
jgi:hypothetical protein